MSDLSQTTFACALIVCDFEENQQGLRVAFSREEKGYPMILRVICLRRLMTLMTLMTDEFDDSDDFDEFNDYWMF